MYPNTLINSIIKHENANDYLKEYTSDWWFCVTCGNKQSGFGNNPLPLSDGTQYRCCDTCNAGIIIPARMCRMGREGDRRFYNICKKTGKRINFTKDATEKK